jgi:hypothetical protein
MSRLACTHASINAEFILALGTAINFFIAGDKPPPRRTPLMRFLFRYPASREFHRHVTGGARLRAKPRMIERERLDSRSPVLKKRRIALKSVPRPSRDACSRLASRGGIIELLRTYSRFPRSRAFPMKRSAIASMKLYEATKLAVARADLLAVFSFFFFSPEHDPISLANPRAPLPKGSRRDDFRPASSV